MLNVLRGSGRSEPKVVYDRPLADARGYGFGRGNGVDRLRGRVLSKERSPG